jgi:hypothetical protein
VRPTAGTSPAGQKDSRLTSTLTAVTIIVVDVSFLVLLQRQRPRRNRLTAIMEVRWTFTASTRNPLIG